MVYVTQFGVEFGWLVGCFGLNGPLRQYFSLYRTVSQREIVGQGPIVLAVGAGRGCLDIFFSHLSFLFSFSLSGRRPDID